MQSRITPVMPYRTRLPRSLERIGDRVAGALVVAALAAAIAAAIYTTWGVFLAWLLAS
jgi:hypothetical protein